MPLTSYHFGPGLLLKSVLPRRFSFAAFAATEVAVDVETLVNLIRNQWPVHDRLHSLPGSLAIGLAVGLATHVVGRAVVKRLPKWAEEPLLESEVSLGGALLGGTAGGVTASLLDAVMHEDLRPFWPISSANPFLESISVSGLHSACLVSAAIGVLVLLWRARGR